MVQLHLPAYQPTSTITVSLSHTHTHTHTRVRVIASLLHSLTLLPLGKILIFGWWAALLTTRLPFLPNWKATLSFPLFLNISPNHCKAPFKVCPLLSSSLLLSYAEVRISSCGIMKFVNSSSRAKGFRAFCKCMAIMLFCSCISQNWFAHKYTLYYWYSEREKFILCICISWGFPSGSDLKNLPVWVCVLLNSTAFLGDDVYSYTFLFIYLYTLFLSLP